MNLVKILIVEDESIVAMDIADKLTKLGYEVTGSVNCGELALTTIQQKSPDLILMDIVLKGAIDGVQTAEKIKVDFDIPIVYLTAYADEHTLQRAKHTEPFGYLVKPFKQAELKATIEIALGRIQAENKIKEGLKACEELRKKTEKINQIKARYLSVASHEFRTPLSVIAMSAELLGEYSDRMSLEAKTKHLSRIQNAIKNIDQLLEDFLILGQADSGELFLNPEPISLVNFCCELIEEQLFSTHHKNPIFFDYQGGCDYACMDMKILQYILNNLISNAIKYSPNGTQVIVSLFAENRQAVFKIKDQGIGILKEDKERLFEAFYRGMNVGTIPGSGLGLTIVKQCVDLHGGTIDLELSEEAGTVFIVRLPLNS